MSNGRIIEPAPNLVSKESVMADKIASIAVPSTGNSIWDGLREAGYGNGVQLQTSGGLGAKVSEPMGTSKLKELQNKLVGPTRSEMAAQTGLRLPSLGSLGPARKGIGTAAQLKNKPLHSVGHSGHAHGPNGECYAEDLSFAVDGGVGAAAQAGNTKFVDDKGWPVTLKQILGSRMLTPELLKKASIQNVQKLISVSGGTADQNQELHYMFQRMMLEGFIRGVDITKELERQGGLHISLNDTISGKSSVIGVAGKAPGKDYVKFGKRWWNSKSEADRYTLFLHEVGHSLIGAHHENNSSRKRKDDSIMTPIYNGSVLKNYNGMLDELFTDDMNDKHNKFQVTPQAGPAKFDKSWFPALSGVDTGYNPSTPTAPGTGEGKEDKPPATEPVQPMFNPMNINMPNLAPTTAQPLAAARPTGAPQSVTPTVGGTLSGDIQTATKTFAAGMADLSSRGPDMESAGALLASG